MKQNTKRYIVAEYFDIAIIGSGNVAWHLAPELENAGNRVLEVFSRNAKNAKALQRKLYNAEVRHSLDFSDSQAQIFVLAISDDAIEQVAQEIALPERAIIVHTSGSQSISKLGYTSTGHFGVFYPLQTFTKGLRLSFEDIPILIEAEDKYTAEVLINLGKSISKKVYEVRSADRMAIHVAAVFACNFTNKMFGIAEHILHGHGFKLDLLKPLIAETINKSLEHGPKDAQTGPAARGDLETLDRHMAFLQGSQYQEVYKIISKKILDR